MANFVMSIGGEQLAEAMDRAWGDPRDHRYYETRYQEDVAEFIVDLLDGLEDLHHPHAWAVVMENLKSRREEKAYLAGRGK